MLGCVQGPGSRTPSPQRPQCLTFSSNQLSVCVEATQHLSRASNHPQIPCDTNKKETPCRYCHTAMCGLMAGQGCTRPQCSWSFPAPGWLGLRVLKLSDGGGPPPVPQPLSPSSGLVRATAEQAGLRTASTYVHVRHTTLVPGTWSHPRETCCSKWTSGGSTATEDTSVSLSIDVPEGHRC